MSRPLAPADALPSTARALALLLAATPGVHDAQPGVLHQLLEFAHRYTGQVLQDAQVYAEHAGRPGRLEIEDATLAVQARVGWEFGGRVPKDYIMSLAAETNAKPLPAVPEVFGLRHPPESECLTHVDFDLVPNRPPPDVKAWDEVLEEVEEPSDDEEAEEEEEEEELAEDMVAPARRARASTSQSEDTYMGDASSAPGEVPASGNHTPDVEMRGTPVDAGPTGADEDDEDDGLFGGDDDEMSADEAPAPPPTMQRKLVEEDDYD